MGYFITLCIGFIFGLIVCAAITNGKIADLEAKIWQLELKLFRKEAEKNETMPKP